MPTSYSKQYAANSAVRTVLQELGAEFDKQILEKTEFSKEIPDVKPLNTDKGRKQHREQALKFFENACCYCRKNFRKENLRPEREHIIPMNRESTGLDCWGNVVFCCSTCNQDRAKRQNKELHEFLSKTPSAFEKIASWQSKFPDASKFSQEIKKPVQSLYQKIVECIDETRSKLRHLKFAN